MNLNAQQELNGKYIMEYSHNAILHNMWASTLQSHAMDESWKVVFRKDAKYKILHSVWFVDRSTKQVRLIYAIRHQDGEYLGHNDRKRAQGRCLKSVKCSILQSRCWLHGCVVFVKIQCNLKIATALWEYSYYYFHLQMGSLRFWAADDLIKVTHFLSGRARIWSRLIASGIQAHNHSDKFLLLHTLTAFDVSVFIWATLIVV